MSIRIPGKLGRRQPKNAPALRLGPLLTGVVPDHPVAGDYLAKLSNWQMLGNDQYGDCVAVTWANMKRLVTATLDDHEVYPTLDEVLAIYKTQNPNFPADDNGMDIQTLLEYLVKTGEILGFAKVDQTNQAEVDAAIAIFGSLWTGITVLQANQQEFGAGQPWDYVAGSPVDGGHSVLSGGWDANAPANDVRFITWAAETGFTDAFWARLTDEVWIVIWKQHLGSKAFQAGIDQAKLAEDYTALTGRPFPSPSPTPTPTPTPSPSGCLLMVLGVVAAALALAVPVVALWPGLR